MEQNKQTTKHWENADSKLLSAMIQYWKRSAINM